MRPYHPYRPDQAALLPPSLDELVPPGDPVRLIREVIEHELDLSGIHHRLRAEKGRPPFHPIAMVGLLLYGNCRGVYSSRRLALACQQNVSFMYLTGRAQPDFRTIALFRKRFRELLEGYFDQVLALCREAGLTRLGHVSLDGSKVRANASKHKSMSYGRLVRKEQALEREIKEWFDRAEREDREEDEEYGPDDDGHSLPPELQETASRLAKVREAKQRLEVWARDRLEQAGHDPNLAQVSDKAQTNFTDPDSRIMHTPDGFQQCYNVQIAVDADSQVIVAQEVSQAPPDVQRLGPMLENIRAANGRYPDQLTADAGYASESNFALLKEAGVDAVIALRRYHRDEPPDADPAQPNASKRWPHRNKMRERLFSPEGKAIYKLRKQTVEPVYGQVKGARGFRQFLCRGNDMVRLEWSLVSTAHNLLKLVAVRGVA
jgi:transposase